MERASSSNEKTQQVGFLSKMKSVITWVKNHRLQERIDHFYDEVPPGGEYRVDEHMNWPQNLRAFDSPDGLDGFYDPNTTRS